MNEEIFWQIIEDAKADAKGDLEAQAILVTEKLAKHSPEDIIESLVIYYNLENLADIPPVFDAHVLTNNGGSDSTFMDFRGWLILQGKNIFYAALENPDVIADLDLSHTKLFLFSVIMDAYQVRTDEEDAPDFTLEQRARIIEAKRWRFNRERPAEFYLAKYPKLAAYFKERNGEYFE
jgi:hypothetical protein